MSDVACLLRLYVLDGHASSGVQLSIQTLTNNSTLSCANTITIRPHQTSSRILPLMTPSITAGMHTNRDKTPTVKPGKEVGKKKTQTQHANTHHTPTHITYALTITHTLQTALCSQRWADGQSSMGCILAFSSLCSGGSTLPSVGLPGFSPRVKILQLVVDAHLDHITRKHSHLPHARDVSLSSLFRTPQNIIYPQVLHLNVYLKSISAELSLYINTHRHRHKTGSAITLLCHYPPPSSSSSFLFLDTTRSLLSSLYHLSSGSIYFPADLHPRTREDHTQTTLPPSTTDKNPPIIRIVSGRKNARITLRRTPARSPRPLPHICLPYISSSDYQSITAATLHSSLLSDKHFLSVGRSINSRNRLTISLTNVEDGDGPGLDRNTASNKAISQRLDGTLHLRHSRF